MQRILLFCKENAKVVVWDNVTNLVQNSGGATKFANLKVSDRVYNVRVSLWHLYLASGIPHDKLSLSQILNQGFKQRFFK